MPSKKINPTTPGRRFYIPPDLSPITRKKPEKSLTIPLRKKGGRNNTGKMTMRYIGGGHKKRIRIIDFKRQKHNVPGIIHSIEYDPIRTAYIALLHYQDGEKNYIIAPEGIKVGSKVLAGKKIAPEIGNAMPLAAIPTGTVVHNIDLHPGKGAAIARSAGAYAQLTACKDKYATLKLPSGEVRKILSTCIATVGSVSNPYHTNTTIGKAGRNRWLGRSPRTRGVAMNPIAHKMGGGEGKASGGHPSSRKGIAAKGQKTRNKKKYSNKNIIKQRNHKK